MDGILVTDPTVVEQSYANFGGLAAGGLSRVEILRGSQSALYGGTAVGGVVSLSSLPDADTPPGLSQSASAQYGSNNAYSVAYGLTYASADARLSFSVTSLGGDGFSAGDDANGNTEADAYAQTRLSFGIEHDASDVLTVGANAFVESGFAEYDEFGFIPSLGSFGPVDGTPDERQDRDAVGARVYAGLALGDWTHDLGFSLYSITRDNAANGTLTTFEGERLAFDYLTSYTGIDGLVLSFGLDGRDETASYPNQAGGTNSVQTIGGFAEAVVSPTEALDVTATLRYDDHSTFGGQSTGRLAAAYRASEAVTLRGAIGTGYRPPSLDELFGDYPGFFPFVGNPDLTPETSLSYELGADVSLTGGAALSVTAFRLQIEDLITYQFATPVSSLVNVEGVSDRFGLEVAAEVPVTDRLTLTGAYTFTQAYTATGERLANIPRHDLVLGLEAEITDRISLGATAQHVADRANGSFDANPYTDYTVVDLGLGYAVTEEIEAFFRVENLFDEQYQTVSGYGTPGQSFYIGLRATY